ncbi:MAG: hypothetical protein AAB893_03320 [Patescibacteria group bacterium]
MSRKAEVFVLQAGYALWEKERNAQRADGTIVLVKSSVNVIVDTGLPKDREVILNGLKKHKLNSSDIKMSYVPMVTRIILVIIICFQKQRSL